MAGAHSPPDLEVELDRCVKCGLCLPECPTYRLRGDESESPRGRLALIEGLTQGHLRADEPAVQRHLDSCLLCRRCERVCPSGVRFGTIMDDARTQLLPPPARRWTDRVVNSPDVLRMASLAARALPAWITRPFPGAHRPHLLGRALTATTPPRPGHYLNDRVAPRGRVALFSGCATAAQQGSALHAALMLLRHAGFDVVVVAGCCGALAHHAGNRPEADRLAADNTAALAASSYSEPLDAVVSIASGCGIHLGSYTPPLPVPHFDICQFLVERGKLSVADFQPRHQTVMLHTPCSMENVYRGADWAANLLAVIPELTVSRIGEPGQCCGSAGDYLLRHPDTAARLRQPLLDAVVGSDADVLSTTNVGCAIHLAAGFAAVRVDVEVLHPVELLARQLIT